MNQRRNIPPLLKPPGGVPIIDGRPKYNEAVRFVVGEVHLHPPAGADQFYLLMVMGFAGGQGSVSVAGAFQLKLLAFLAEDKPGIGLKGAPVMLMPQPDGSFDIGVLNDKGH